ncbi:MAG: zinc ABC transporter substrate-binding protein [Clostridia bacterium]|nr:zinc ABC transporter substrate-binding protein [Clostridia bacterium]
MKKIFIYILSLCLLLISLTSCADTQQNGDDDASLTIVTTIFPIYDWVRNITGSTDGIVYLDGSGIDMHSFEPTANDIITLANADIFICIGGASDEWVDAAVSSCANENLTVIKLIDITGGLTEEAVEGMQEEDDHGHDTDTSELDEHIWLSLKNAQTAVSAIAKALGELDTVNRDTYLSNAENYNQKLTELDGRYAQTVASAEKNTLIFADRFPFRYLTEDYSLNYYAAFPGCSAESEASFKTITFLIEKTKELQLDYIIILENSDGKLAGTIADETGAKALTLNSCQSVTSTEIENGKTYLSVMEENLAILTEALS